MKSGDEESEDHPKVTLLSPQPAACALIVRAQYEAAGRGLVLSVHSKLPGLLPPTDLEWDNLNAESSDEPPTLPPQLPISFSKDELPKMVTDLKRILAQPLASHAVQTDLKAALKNVSKFLRQCISSSAAEEWRDLSPASRSAVSELVSMLGFLVGLRNGQLRSPVFPDGCAGFERPQGRAQLATLDKDADLQYQLHICLRRLAAAAPEGFLARCLTQIDNAKTQPRMREACIYSLGRCATSSPALRARCDGFHRILTQLQQIARQTLDEPDQWKEFGCWAQSLALFLGANPWHIADLHLKELEQLAWSLHAAIQKLTASRCPDEHAWRPALACLLYLRYAMRVQDEGPKCFGPKSALARALIEALRGASRSEPARIAARVNFRRFIENPEILQGDSPFDKLALIWEGKATGVLLRASIEDE
jgi:hypothetical protein